MCCLPFVGKVIFVLAFLHKRAAMLVRVCVTTGNSGSRARRSVIKDLAALLTSQA